MSVPEVEQSLSDSHDILMFLASTSTDPGLVLCEDAENGRRLILLQAIALLRAAGKGLRGSMAGGGDA